MDDAGSVLDIEVVQSSCVIQELGCYESHVEQYEICPGKA